MSKRIIYLDNGASTKVHEEIVEIMKPYNTQYYGNASSMHSMGRIARTAVEEARKKIAESVNSDNDEIIFTSGGTESNNHAIKGAAFANMNKGKHIITTKIEHDCVLNTCKYLERKFGFEVTYLKVDEYGLVDIAELKKSIKKDTILVSIMHANNEIGTIQDIKTIGQICKLKGVIFHTDACQSYTKVPINVKEMNIDLMTINSHKIQGPKGVGALYIRRGVKIDPLLHGGGHEFKHRSGTENVPGIIGFAKAVELAGDSEEIAKLRDYTIKELLKIKNTKLNGHSTRRLPNNVSISFFGIEGESVLMKLDEKGICVSTGSACSSHSLETSHVLRAIGLKAGYINGTIRITLSKYTTKEEIDYAIQTINEAVNELRKFTPLKNLKETIKEIKDGFKNVQ